MRASERNEDLTPDWTGFCNLWLYIGAHWATYGAAPDFKETAAFLGAGGFVGAATRRAKGQVH